VALSWGENQKARTAVFTIAFLFLAMAIQPQTATGNMLYPSPQLIVSSPSENGTYQSNVPLNVKVDLFGSETLRWLGFSLDGKPEVGIFVNTRSGSVTGADMLYGLSNGWHGIYIRGETSLNITFEKMIFFLADTVPPNASILSVENETYNSSDVPLIFSVDKNCSWIAYSLDNRANITVNGNTTLTGLFEGSHGIIVYANDTVGNIGCSQTTFFTIVRESESTDTPNPQPDWYSSAMLVTVASVTLAFAISVTLLVYFKKRKRNNEPKIS
jgi:hypothetical protein